MKILFSVILILAYWCNCSTAQPLQAQLTSGYRPQITSSDINYPFFNSWDGFVDVPFVGMKILKPFYYDWYLFAGYRYIFKTQYLPAGNKARLKHHMFTVGPYYRSATTENETFFINLSAGLGVSITGFEMDVAGVSDNFNKTEPAVFASLGFEKMIYGPLSIIMELTYNAVNSKVKGTIGNNATDVETTINTSGLDIALTFGYEFGL
ncbi:MAG: PorT family protein [candidate division Zixibacteria bacterium]|nr:PorT family protein [candidate division Zixibacteria bacterium]